MKPMPAHLLSLTDGPSILIDKPILLFGRHQECDEGYGLIDLYDDGTFEREYVKYGWKAEG